MSSEDQEEVVVFYGLAGKIVDSEPRALAKVITKNSKEYFFVWFWRGDLYDPYGPDILRKSQQFMSKFMKVNKEVFDFYYKYLKTKNRIYLTRAKRMSLT